MGGYRLTPLLSIDVELAVDIANPDNLQPSEKLSKVTILTLMAPLLHLPIGVGEFVVGPTIGLGYDVVSYQLLGASGGSIDYTAQAWSFGARGGFFFYAGRKISIGGVLAFDYTKDTSYLACVAVNGSCTTYAPATKVVSLSAAVLF